ncbi:hypothetical protein SAY86_017258 [Trapa natans]|uniref:Ribosomal protein L9 n=1 Tax=Trapa natans TaxID=22666 RepID=A0AAN7LR05_TRANT|nr:hypothetical protein SAY86_017258 [Trapa natans]
MRTLNGCLLGFTLLSHLFSSRSWARGNLTRDFKHLNLDFQLIKDEAKGKRKLKIDAWFGSRKTSAAIRTALSHVENLISGVTQGYRYNMRFVYAHFPINAIEIPNFLGEKKVRSCLTISYN